MESYQSLSIESFSYSWLVNLKPSLETLDSSLIGCADACDEAFFIEMDPRKTPSKRFFHGSQDFKFDFPVAQSPLTLVHADELFSDGYLMPLFVDRMKMDATSESSDSTSALPTSTSKPEIPIKRGKRSSSFRRCQRMSKRMFLKYLLFLRPLYQRICGRYSLGSGDRRKKVIKNRIYSEEMSSPRISVASSADNWRQSCDSESSIYEAVLHCKKSIEK